MVQSLFIQSVNDNSDGQEILKLLDVWFPTCMGEHDHDRLQNFYAGILAAPRDHMRMDGGCMIQACGSGGWHGQQPAQL